jgi:putative ABC transport system permease protein
VAIVNSTLARRYFDGGDPLGGRVTLDAPPRTVEIVGVTGDVKADRLENPDWPTVYLPYPQAPSVSMSLAVRASGDPRTLANAIVREIRRLDPDQPVAEVRTMEQVLGEAVAGPRFNAFLLSVFAAVAFVLAAVGIYGVISYNVTERTHEFGIRLALGATSGDIGRQVLWQGARLAGIGLAAGLAASYFLAGLLATLLYAVRHDDLPTFAAMALLLGAVALAASYLPSRRATAVDPMRALRHE